MPPLYAAALVVLLEALCFTTGFPVISYYAQQLGGDALWIGIVFALVSWPKAISNPLWGLLSERVGRRAVLAINTVGTLAGSILWALSPSIAWLAASRACIGVFGGQAGLAQAIAADVSPPERRAAAMGVLGAAFALSLAIGPPLGGWMAERVSYASVGWLCAGFQVASLVVILCLLPETRRAAARDSAAAFGDEPVVALGDAYRNGSIAPERAMILLIVVTFVLWAGLSTLNSTYGLLCEQTYGFSVQETGYALGVLGLGLALVQGGVVRALSKRLSDRTIALIGCMMLVWGLSILAKPPPLWGLWVGTALYAFGAALATPCLTSMITRVTPDDRQGVIAGVSQGVIAIGRGVGNMLGGSLYRHYAGPRMPFAAAAAIVFVALFVLLLSGSKSRERSASVASV